MIYHYYLSFINYFINYRLYMNYLMNLLNLIIMLYMFLFLLLEFECFDNFSFIMINLSFQPFNYDKLCLFVIIYTF